MHSAEQRRLAIETFIRFDHSYADTIAELGYPDRHTLNSWWREYRGTGEVPVGKMIREPRFSDDQKREAAEHCLGHGKSLSRTMRALGYPKGSDTLRGWIDELAPGQRKYRGPNPKRVLSSSRRRYRRWPSPGPAAEPLRRSPGSTACRARRPTSGEGRLWGIMAGTPKRKASP